MTIKVNNYFKFCSWVVINSFMLAAYGISSSRAQDAQETYLFLTPGTVITKGHNTVPTGELKVLTYRLEEVVPTKPTWCTINEERQQVNRVLRLAITGEQVFNGAFIIWIGDEMLDGVMSGPELRTIICDPTFLEDEAVISVSRYAENWRAQRTQLPEHLSVPPQWRGRRASPSELGNIVAGIRRINSSGKPYVEITLNSRKTYPIMNNFLLVQIGEEEFYPTEIRKGMIKVRITLEAFSGLKDGDRILVKVGQGIMPGIKRGRYFGMLNKRMLKE